MILWGRWLPLLTIVSFSTPLEWTVLLSGLTLFCPLFVGDLILPCRLCYVRPGRRDGAPSRIARPVGSSWVLTIGFAWLATMLFYGARWYLGRAVYAALTLAISSFLFAYW